MENIIKVHVLPIEQQETESTPTIIISSDLQKQTNTVEGQKILVKAGHRIQDCFVHLTASPINMIYCSKLVLENLLIPVNPFYTFLKFHSTEGLWEFGPFIGIVTDQIKKNHFGSLHSFLNELQTYGHENNLFVFVFNHGYFHTNYVDGFYYNPANTSWLEAKLPIPHVVHNRIHSRLKERSEATKYFFEQLTEAGIPYFNERFLNKWEVYEILSRYDHLIPYLPETKLLNGRITLEEMADKHLLLFIKPVHGSLGKNIFRVEQKEENFFLDYTTFSGDIEKQYATVQPLYDVIKPRLQKQRYIVQQGIQLLTYDNRPLDFRLLCHCQNDTMWVVTSIVARVSSKNEFVSNLARGGEIFKINKVLTTHFDKKTSSQIEQLLKEIAIETASIIQQNVDGIFGELGIDLALDKDGKPWIIEINTKPSKNQEPDGFSPKIRPSAKAILDYCYRLSGWKN